MQYAVVRVGVQLHAQAVQMGVRWLFVRKISALTFKTKMKKKKGKAFMNRLHLLRRRVCHDNKGPGLSARARACKGEPRGTTYYFTTSVHNDFLPVIILREVFGE